MRATTAPPRVNYQGQTGPALFPLTGLSLTYSTLLQVLSQSVIIKL